MHPQFEFLGIEVCSLADQSHHVALYAFHGVRFALLPGGSAVLGHDPRGARDGGVYYRLDEDGTLHAEQEFETTHEQVLKEMADQGFRLPPTNGNTLARPGRRRCFGGETTFQLKLRNSR